MSDLSKQEKNKNKGAIKEAKGAEKTCGLSPFEEMDRLVESFFSRGSLSRTIALPDNADIDNIKAAFNNGMLQLTIPKTEKAERHTIAID